MPSSLLGFALLAMAISPAAQAKLNVVVTTPDLAAITSEIAGPQAAVTALAKPTEDPHFVDAKPSFILKLNRADALIEGGAELESGWLPALLENSRNPKVAPGTPGLIACVPGVDLLDVPANLDRSKGDLHALGNPHFMTDPLQAKIAAQNICEGLCKLEPASAELFRGNLVKFNTRLEAKLAEWQKQLAPYQGARLVAYHNTWPYFARRFGLRIDLFLEPKPGIPPTPAHLTEIIARMKAEHIRLIIVEPYQSRRTAEKVAAATQAAILDFTQYPGGVKGAEGGYLELMDYLVRSLAQGLAGKLP